MNKELVDDLINTVDAVLTAHKKSVDEKLGIVAKRLNDMEGRLQALERENAAKSYRGVWTPGAYEKHNLATLGGCIWVAMRDTDSKPGTDDSWKLAVNKGRDARRNGAESRSY